MSSQRWWPHRLAVLALLAVLAPALLAALAPGVALGQTAGCSMTGADVTLTAVNCQLGATGLLSGTFTAPDVPVAWPVGRPGECTQGGGLRSCVYEIAITACAQAGPGRCASANFGLEIRTRVTPVSPPPVSPVSPPVSPVSSSPVVVRAKVIAAGPLIALDPQAGAPGTPVTVSGSGFAAAAPATSPAPAPVPAPATSPAPAPVPTTGPAQPTPSSTAQVTPASDSNLAGPGLGLLVLVAILAAAFVLVGRRLTSKDASGGGGPAAQVYARVAGPPPRPVLRNVARGPARTVRLDVRRPDAATAIAERSPHDDSSEPAVRVTRIPVRPG